VHTFSLTGGPLHRLGARLGLVRGTSSVLLGLALGPLVWVVLLALGLIEGVARVVFSLSVLGSHVRLLVVIPLIFLAETWLDPRVTTFVRTIVGGRVVPAVELPALDAVTDRVGRWRDSWVPEAACLLGAVLLGLLGARLQPFGTSSAYDPARAVVAGTAISTFYWGVCLTLFRFLVLRLLWRLGLWWYLLWRVSRLNLNLVPTHPDGVAGLGYLEVVQATFGPIVVAISAMEAASFAEAASVGEVAFDVFYPWLALILVIDAVWLFAPLLVFAPKLWACRDRGLDDYMNIGSHYVNDFDRKWRRGEVAPGESLLGTPDLQSLADLGNSLDRVQRMRLVPVSSRLVVEMALAALVPMAPLLLLKYPIAELAQKFFTGLAGL
jgi:hypothetical protein